MRKKREANIAKLKEEKEDVKKMDGKVQRFLARCQVQKKSISNKVTRGCSIYNPANAMKVNNEIEEIKKALEDISKVMRDFRFKEATIVPNVTHHARGSGSRVIATEVIGREKDRNEIVNLLLAASDDEKAIRAVSIVGMGGMGKTTLAQLVYNYITSHKDCKFDMKLWASDCKKFELKVLLKDLILSSDSNANLNHDSLDYLKNQFVERIRGKKVFIVLDDVEIEDVDIWDHLRLLLIEGNMKESRILVTTRSQAAARRIGTNNSTYQLEGLSEDDSWSLFERRANLSGNKNREKLIKIGKGIVERCAGVPLAIKVIGSYLKTESISTWEYVRDFEWKDEKIPIIPILKISYDGLDSTLKQCFSLCAVFPKNFKISLPVLSNVWITNVRFNPIKGKTPLQVCDDSLKILCERFFLEDISDGRHGSYMKMHDLMHDLSTDVAGEEILMVEGMMPVVLEENIRHLNLNGRVKYDAISTFLEAKGKRLRTFLNVSFCYPRWEILGVDKLVTACPFLRVLDLRFCIKKLTDSIGKLIHLRYLDISWNKFETLPDSFTELINLRYLNLELCVSLTCLPDRMDALTSLEELDLKQCSKLEQLPTGIGKLTNLRYLNLYACESLTCLPDRMDALTSLEELDLDFCYNLKQLPTSIVTLANLRYLKLKCCKSLTCLPDKVEATSLEELNLFKSFRLEQLPTGIGKLTNLRYLNLESCSSLTCLPDRMDAFTSLEQLDLKRCSKLEQLPPGIVKLTNLKYLNLYQCSSLTCLPDRIDALTSLEELNLSECSKLEQLPPGIVKLTNLKYLNLYKCSSLTCLPDRIDALTSLEELTFAKCCKLKQLPPGIVKLTNLKNLIGIDYCGGLTEMPSGMGALMPLVSSSVFRVGHLGSKHGAQLEELELLSELKEGKLTIQLPSKTALKVGRDCKAYLVNKKWLRDLEIKWKGKREEDMEVEPAENHIDILSKLQPPTDLEIKWKGKREEDMEENHIDIL